MYVTAERHALSVGAVKLNGVELKNCIAASDTEGYAIIIRSDADGKIVPCAECGGLVEQVVHGDIEIVFANDPKPAPMDDAT